MNKLLIFDLDGTLLNTIEDICTSINKALSHYNLPLHDINKIKRMVGNGVDKLIERAVYPHLECVNDVKDFYLKDYNANCSNKTKPYDGIKELLMKFKINGHKLAVLSNKPHHDTIKVINSYFGESCFDYVIGNKKENRIKPHPDGVNEIIRALNWKELVVFIGDSEVDAKTAINSNCIGIAVLWGFREKEELLGANYFVSDCDELFNIIERL